VTPDGLRVFRDPESVAVVGASADPAKWGYWLARGALAGAHRRAVHLVNRHGAEIDGHPSVPGLDAIAGPLDLVVLCVPPAGVPALVAEGLARGARGFLGITAGLDRAVGRPGAERELAAGVRAAGARIVGPNCLGIYDASTDLRLAWGEFDAGSLGIVSQSGQLGSELSMLAAARGLGVSRFVSTGNQVDVTAVEVLADLVHHEQTRVVAVYLESFADGRQLVEVLRALRDAGKQPLVLTVGASEAGRDAARSHSGAMTSALDVVDAACRAAGAIRVDTPTQLVEIAHMLVVAPRPAGGRVAIVGDSGGQGALAADILGAAGLRVAALRQSRQHRLASLLPADAAVANPVDLAGAGEQDLGVYAAVVEELLSDDDVDAVTVTGYLGSYGLHTPSLQASELAVTRRIAAASQAHRKPVALHAMCRDSATLAQARRQGLPTYQAIETAAASLAGAARIGAGTGRRLTQPGRRRWDGPLDGYLAARCLLASAGVPFPGARRVTERADVARAAADLRAPYVLKADWVLHKTEARAVAVGLPDADRARRAYDDMRARLGPGAFVLEEMDTRTDTVELVVGTHRDPSFGPVVTVGAGGTQAELLRDTVLELAPVDEATALSMLGRLRVRALLDGWRGRPPVDVAGLAATVAAVSRLLFELPACAEIEVNPLRVGPDGPLAVDALVTRAARPEQETP
jgi:acetate---CoA ligase (ADP-forming)